MFWVRSSLIIAAYLLWYNTKEVATVEKFPCANGKIIEDYRFCDGKNDCGDYSDETYGCNNAACQVGQFSCSSLMGYCVQSTCRCDGYNDCMDSSDEKFCEVITNKIYFEKCVGNRNESGSCQPTPILTEADMPKPADETCFEKNGTIMEWCLNFATDYASSNCTHPPYKLPNGAEVCFCRKEDTDNPMCQKVIECKQFLCQHKCVSFEDQYQCSCNNYTIIVDEFLDEVMEPFCRHQASGVTALLSTTSNSAVGRICYKESEGNRIVGYIPSSDASTQVTSVAGHKEFMYWSENNSKGPAINVAPLENQFLDLTITSIVQGTNFIRNISSLDIDYLNGNIYFSDIETGFIGMCNSNGTRCTALLTVDKPKTIALDPKKGLMFWGTIGGKAHIGRSHMDGEEVTEIIQNLPTVWSLAVDPEVSKVYWLDNIYGVILICTYDGQNKQIVRFDPNEDMSGLKVVEGFLKWSAVGGKKVHTLRPFNNLGKSVASTVMESFAEDISVFNNIYAYNPLEHAIKRNFTYNPCSTKPCGDAICVPKPGSSMDSISYSCLCTQAKSEQAGTTWCSLNLIMGIDTNFYH